MAARDRRSLATALLLLLALASPSPALAALSSPAQTQLAAGEHGSYSWSVKANRLAGSRPCVSVAITHHHGPFSYDRSRFNECVLASPGLTRSTSPLLVGGTHLGDVDGMTVFGVLAAAGTRKVRATISGGHAAARVSTRLAPVALTASRAGDLRFAVIVIPGRHCVERLATVGPLGRDLWEGTPTEHACDYPGPVPSK